jgi:hypothetical protein
MNKADIIAERKRIDRAERIDKQMCELKVAIRDIPNKEITCDDLPYPFGTVCMGNWSRADLVQLYKSWAVAGAVDELAKLEKELEAL